MSLTSDYLKHVNKKKKKEDKTEAPLYVNQTAPLYVSDDIAPVFLNNTAPLYLPVAPVTKATPKTTTKAQTEEKKERKWFEKGAFEDGYQFGDVIKTILGTDEDIVKNVKQGAAKMGENVIDAAVGGVGQVGKLFGADGFAENTKEFVKKDLTQMIPEVPAELRGATSTAIGTMIPQFAPLINAGKAISALNGELNGEKDNSVLGDRADGVIQSATRYILQSQLQSVGVPWQVTAGVTSYGSELEAAYNEDATHGEAAMSGLVSAGGEIISEYLTGGAFGTSGLDDVLVKDFSRNISNKTLRSVLKFGVKSVGEGFVEEPFAWLINKIGQRLTYKDENTLRELLTSDEAQEELVDSVVGGFLISGVAQGGDFVKAKQNGVDYTTGLTDNEEKVVNHEYQNRLAKEEKNGKVTNSQKNAIYEEVVRDMERGRISTETIEEVLGGEEYSAYKGEYDAFFGGETLKAYKDTVANEDAQIKQIEEQMKALENEPDTIDKYNALESQIEGIKNSAKRNELNAKLESEAARISEIRNQLRTNVSEMVKGDRLYESYNELIRSEQTFVPDFDKFKGSKYEDVAKRTLESAVAAGAKNNSQAHDIVDLAAKTSSDTGIAFVFKRGEQIKDDFIKRQTERIAKLEKVENPTEEQTAKLEKMKDKLAKVQNGEIKVNGAFSADGIVLNLDAEKPLNRVVGHEVMHSLKKHGLYKAAYNALIKFSKNKGEYQARYDALVKLYEGVEEDDVKEELAADLVGDYLFSDENFVKHLSVTNRNVFQKIYDEIKYLYKVATAGSKEARELERVKKIFERVYREGGKAQTDTKYSVSYTKTNQPVAVIESDIFGGKFEELTDSERLKIVKDAIKGFRPGIPVSGRLIGISRKSAGHFTNSDYTDMLRNNDQKLYEDKLNIAQNLDDVVYATTDYINEDLKHPRKDNITQFARGTVLLDIGGNKYEADVLVGYTSMQDMILYDVQDMRSTEFEIKEKKAQPKLAGNESYTRKTVEPSIDDIVPQQEETVKRNYSLSDSDGNQLTKEQQDFFKVMDGGSVTKFSLSTWTPETQQRVSADLVKFGYEKDQVDKWIKDTNGIASAIAADRDRLDFDAADNHTMLKNNKEYVKTLDASTLCDKRRIYQGTFDAIQHRMPNTMLSSDDLIDLLNMMKEHNVQTPCGVCYVESRRRHLGKFAQEWLNKYDGEYKPSLDEVTTSDGLEELRKKHPDTYNDFVTAMNAKGSANPKVVQLRTEYRNEIMSLTPAQIRKIESIGGLRVQSFSDFETPHLLDMMQAVMDMSAKGLTSQAYTKVPNFAWVFGNTGIKINLSLIADGNGFDSNGDLAFSSVEGMEFTEAMKLRDAYSENVGTIIVGANDKHILACMADDRIDFIIPFHRSGWGQKELDMMGMSDYTDYTYGQNEHSLDTGKTVQNLYPPDYWDYTLSGKENAERYLNLCAKTGREPKFSQFLVNNGDGSYSLKPDGSTDGYWKTLIDFKMYDNDGNGAAQQKVQPNFNMKEAYRVLEEYEGGANSLPVAKNVVEEFVAKYQEREMEPAQIAPAMSLSRKTDPDILYSLSEIPLDQRVSGDALLDAEDLIAEIENVADISPNGYVTVYHRTTEENAKRIIESGKMSAKEDGIFFSTQKDGVYSSDYGKGVVRLRVPAEKLVLDDIFDGEAHLKIPLQNKLAVLDVSEYLSDNSDIQRSLSRKGEQSFVPVNRSEVYGKDIALETAAPVQTAPVKSEARNTQTVEQMLPDDLAPVENADAYAPVADGTAEDAMVETNIGKMPVSDYRDIIAQQNGFDDYADMRRQGVILGNKYDTDDIAPVAKPTQAAPEAYEAIRPKREVQPRMAKSTPAEQARAKVMTEEPKSNKKKPTAWNLFKDNVVDKGTVFETLSLKTGNRELQAKWKSIGRAESSAQWFMEHGNAETDSLKSIRETVEKSGKTQQFFEYLYHMHNVDRMNLEDRYDDVENKPVFGYGVTSDISKAEAAKLETANPEFKQWAESVYSYMTTLREMMVENGVISRETAELWAEMYPHYVPVRRKGDDGLNINVALDSRKTGINAPVKKATGGNRDILPLFDTMAMRTEQTFKAIARNRFGVELKNLLGTTIEKDAVAIDEAIDSVETELLQEGKDGNNPTFTVFENGERVTFEITEEMYDTMKPKSKVASYTNKVMNKANNIRRGLLTEYNPAFMLTNPIKDTQDVLINSQHPAKTYANYPKAMAELWNKKGQYYQEYMEHGGEQNTYFDGESKTFTKDKSGLSKIIGFPLEKISQANNFIEKVPRMAEYIASRKMGRSIDVSMLDAARVTTDFSAGGDMVKMLNRNGFTFLNASVQGAVQQVRNVREAKAEGLKGWVKLATKVAAAGLPAMLLNHLLWDDDEDYEELSDYVKQNYYIVAKYGDGKFVRIPKGRALAVIQNGFKQMEDLITGNDEADFNAFAELVISNLAPNNPLENNLIAPIMQAANNKTWYGDDLVPTRLQDVPAAEQYDETTDSLSKWLGEKLDISPYKINYVLDQYSGAVGDMFLPMMSPEAERGNAGLLGDLIAPISDKFTTDSVLKNQNVSDFYTKKEELTVNANASGATDEDVLMSKYMNSVNADLAKLYAEKREIQNSDMPNKKKYEAVRNVQKQIVELTKEALSSYGDISFEDDYREGGEYARMNGKLYKLNKDGEWSKLSAEQATKYEVTKAAGDASYATDGTNHYRWYVPGEDADKDAEPGWRKVTEKELERQQEVTKGLGISPETYWNNREEYTYAYDYPENYAVAKSVGGYEAYKGYSSDLYDIKADKDKYGKSISGSRKEKVLDYINNLDADYHTRIILWKSEYPSDDSYNNEIIDYLNGRDDLSFEERIAILRKLGFEVTDDGDIYW